MIKDSLNKLCYLVFILLNSQLIDAAPSSQSICELNTSNFEPELAQGLEGSGFVTGWGPKRKILALNEDLQECLDKPSWQRERVVAAANFIIKKKINYCHHYLPNYLTPVNQRHAKKNQGGYCNPAVNIDPRSPTYQQQVRWNYSGEYQETLQDWRDKDGMWYGLDCSNYTTFLYNFALGVNFSSDIKYQAGQNQQNISPNEQTAEAILNHPRAAGKLVCWDNTTEVNHSCEGHGQYISSLDENGELLPTGSVTAAQLAKLPLLPGDLLFIKGSKGRVVHVVMWIGKQVGYGVNDINPSQIAPNKTCPADWMPKVGDWVITDSHYQGPDYRVLTACYYLNQLWGVRRVIGQGRN